MDEWKKQFKFDPIPPLILTESKALLYFIRYDLLDEDVGSIKQLWKLKLLKGAKVKDYKLWISYLICRTFKRYFS